MKNTLKKRELTLFNTVGVILILLLWFCLSMLECSDNEYILSFIGLFLLLSIGYKINRYEHNKGKHSEMDGYINSVFGEDGKTINH